MKIQSDPDLHLTYCLNIHPGEGLSDVSAAIETHAVRVRDRIAAGSPFGLGLRLGARAVDELDDAAMEGLSDLLTRQNMYAFTINGFPYGGFHGERVKENVYAPDWRTEERKVYTLKLASILSKLLPEGVDGSISTVPVSYGAWMKDESDVGDAVRMLVETVAGCAKLEQESGKRITIALEPEPDCYVQRSKQVVAFFNDRLLMAGAPLLSKMSGVSPLDAEAMVRRYLGVCFDTCHAAVQFEDAAEAIGLLSMEGIDIAKVQLSSAVKTLLTSESRERLREFIDEVYLHQTRVRLKDGSVLEYPDLDEGLLDSLEDGAEMRTHFHVPLWWDELSGIEGTSASIQDSCFAAMRSGVTQHVEVETYTFDVLPDDMRAMDVSDNIVRELQWAMAKLTT